MPEIPRLNGGDPRAGSGKPAFVTFSPAEIGARAVDRCRAL